MKPLEYYAQLSHELTDNLFNTHGMSCDFNAASNNRNVSITERSISRGVFVNNKLVRQI